MPHEFGFPKEYRVRSKKEFENVFKNGKRFMGEGLVCYWFSDEEMGNRLGIVVSKKVGTSVERNRIKRYIREYYRLNRPRFKKKGTLIIVARPAISEWEHQRIDEELERLLISAEIIDG